MNERLTDEEISEIVMANAIGEHPTAMGLARAIESAVLARAAVPAVQPQEPVAFIDLDTGEHLDERGEPLKPADTVFDRWYATQAHQLSNEQVCRVIWRAGWNAGVAAAFGMEPLYAAPQAEARQEPVALAAQERATQIAEAFADLPDALRAHPGIKRLYRAAALSSTPAQGDGGTGGVDVPNGEQR